VNIQGIALGTTATMGSVELKGSGGRTCRVNKTWIHPSWDPNTRANDVALVRLDCIVNTTLTIRPVTLPTATDPLRTRSGEPVVMTGFERQKGV
jgi:hypothetical protein